MIQVNEKEWNENAYPVYLCVIPFTRKELEKKFGLTFFEYNEEGLGELCACVVKINKILFWLGAPVGNESLYLNALSRCREKDSELALKELLNDLDINKNDLEWHNNNLGPARWVLSRLDDNNNEVEMLRFQDKDCANWVKKKYEEKGHKQSYFVKHVK